MDCPFCRERPADEVLINGDLCFFMDNRDPVLVGSGMILSRAHRVTVFDLTPEEWVETQEMLCQAKALLDEKYRPDGYTVGWNSGAAGGQTVAHVHLHVIPRFKDEPFAGHGIRYNLKQPENQKTSQNLTG